MSYSATSTEGRLPLHARTLTEAKAEVEDQYEDELDYINAEIRNESGMALLRWSFMRGAWVEPELQFFA